MPVRIRLAYHPLARKKEPLYHIVVAKSKTGRQRKPLEVIGVYDPIPRYPTTPNGQVLEDRDKVKKISMNVDRVKYWLSVGAQPTNHCARLFAKAELMPKKPVYTDRIKKPSVVVSSAINQWGHLNQGPAKLSASTQPQTQPQSPSQPIKQTDPSQTGTTIHESIIAPTGDHIQSEARKLSFDLVAGVMKESRYKEVSVHPGNPSLLSIYTCASPRELHNAFLKFWKQHNKPFDIGMYHRLERTFGERRFALIPLRIFMAYVQPSPEQNEHYNFVRYRLFQGWMELCQREEYAVFKNVTLPVLLRRLFTAWDKVSRQLEEENVFTQKERGLRDSIQQRVQLWNFAEEDKVLKEKELEGWKEIWEVGRYGWLNYKESEGWNPPLHEIMEPRSSTKAGSIVELKALSAEEIKASRTEAEVREEAEVASAVESETSTDEFTSSEGESKQNDEVVATSSQEFKT